MTARAHQDAGKGEPQHIVIVGGGLGGLTLATKLGQTFKRTPAVNVSLVDVAPIHVWKPMLHTFAAGTSNAHLDGVPLVAQAKRAGFRFMPGALCGLDPHAQTLDITLTDLPSKEALHHSFGYDILVLAIGSVANDFGVEGVAEHCHFIDTLQTSDALNKSLRAQLAHSVITEKPLSIAIVGGGATGVEFAADVAALAQLGESYGAVDLPSKIKITLLNSSDRLLAGFPQAISDQVTAELTDLGITVKNACRVKGASEDGFTLADGSTVEAGIKVWAAGTKAPPVLANLQDVTISRSGGVVVDQHLRVAPFDSIFALGDCAAFTPEGQERPLPPTGQVARQQAAYLKRAIKARMRGKEPAPFVYSDQGSLVSLGRFGGYGQLLNEGPLPGIAIKGVAAKLAHAAFYRLHQFGLFGFARGCIVILRDMLDRLVRPPIRLD
ncbi:MAG: NAD(P)/FAD-dependent oxidoreductase [Pseudomonadota bacterium]